MNETTFVALRVAHQDRSSLQEVLAKARLVPLDRAPSLKPAASARSIKIADPSPDGMAVVFKAHAGEVDVLDRPPLVLADQNSAVSEHQGSGQPITSGSEQVGIADYPVLTSLPEGMKLSVARNSKKIMKINLLYQ